MTLTGTDGVAVRGATRRRFYPHAQIARVEVARRGVALVLTDGERVGLGTGSDEAHARALAARIERARGVATDTPETSARAEALDRGARSLAEWRAGIAALVGAAGAPANYRGSRIDRGELLRVVADPDVPADRRVGAAMALGLADDADAAARVRVAAQSCADDRVRVALETIADASGSGAAADDAIEAATGAEATRRRSRRV